MKITRRQLRKIISEAMSEKPLPGFYRNNVQQSGRGKEGDLEVDFFELYQALESLGVRIIEYGDEMVSYRTEQIGAFLFYIEPNDNLDSIIASLNREWAPIKWSVSNPQNYMGKDQITVRADFSEFGEPVYGYGR